MNDERRNVGASVRARLLNRAHEERSDFQVLLTRFTLERLLYRLSVSEHRTRFVLKGAMLFAVWINVPFRPTRDLDLLGYGDRGVDAIADAFRAICAFPVTDDGVQFDVAALSASPIREDLKYAGVRVRTTAIIDRARIPVQVDIGFGDAVTPAPIEIDYPVLLDMPAPRLRAYPIETVVAEKFETLVARGIVNTRLKDYYDLWLIGRTFQLNASSLAAAMRRTFERRGTPLPAAPPVGLTDEFATAKAAQWRTFLGRERVQPAPADFAHVVSDLRNFLVPITSS
jgi:predicted nucleotidyltransferase component of viral defense system